MFKLFAAISLLLALSAPARSNGWEHGAVPFAALIGGLAYDDAATREKAAQSLGFRGQAEAVPFLLQTLREPEKNWSVRSAIYEALGKLGHSKGRPALMRCLDEETREELIAICAEALGGVPGPETVIRLGRLMRETDSRLILRRSIVALGRIGDDDAVSRLARLAEDEDDPSRLPSVIAALGQSGNPNAGLVLAGLLDRARDDGTRFRILSALAVSPSRAATSSLKDLMAESDDPRLRAGAAVALASAEGDDAASALSNLLEDPSPLVQFHALEALRRLKPLEAATPLSQFAEAMARALSEQPVSGLIADPDRAIEEAALTEAALRAVTEIEPSRSLNAFMEAARYREIEGDGIAALSVRAALYDVRRAALYGLGYTKSPEAARFLKSGHGIGDPDARLRAVAARSLAVLGQPDVVSALIPLLADESAEVRWTAAEVLGALGDPLALDAIAESLTDPDSRVRAAAAGALAYLPAEKIRPSLERLQRADDSAKVRAAAGYALDRLRNAN